MELALIREKCPEHLFLPLLEHLGFGLSHTGSINYQVGFGHLPNDNIHAEQKWGMFSVIGGIEK